jgi:hypothetical protein
MASSTHGRWGGKVGAGVPAADLRVDRRGGGEANGRFEI